MARATVVLFCLVATLASGASVKKPSKKPEHPLIRPVCGALASCTAEAATLPIDIAKVCVAGLSRTFFRCTHTSCIGA